MSTTPRLVFAAAIAALVAPAAFAHSAVAEMRSAAVTFLDSLSPELRKQATYALTDAERENWNFVPIARQGAPFKQMTAMQQALALALLRTGLSEAGMHRTHATISLELVLKELENGAARRDPTLYFVTIFGEPSTTGSWGWRFEGHHLSFNFTVVDGKHVFFAPSFIGSNPAEVRSGPRKGERVLREEDDLGRAFVLSLDNAQRKTAVFSDKAPAEIVTVNNKRAEPLSPAGISYAQLKPAQQEKLVELTQLYLRRWRPELADEAWQKIERAGRDKLTFAWAGGFERGQANYYRIQSPDYLIEFDNTQNGANHIHTAVREFKGDFGHDLLREHYAKHHAKHHANR